jgi:hypothetical protein
LADLNKTTKVNRSKVPTNQAAENDANDVTIIN